MARISSQSIPGPVSVPGPQAPWWELLIDFPELKSEIPNARDSIYDRKSKDFQKMFPGMTPRLDDNP